MESMKNKRPDPSDNIALIIIIFLVIIVGVFATGCSFEDEADVASYNISKEADNFNIYRHVIVYNNQSDETLLEFYGWCSITKDNTDNQLEITYRVGKDEYYKDFVGLNDRTGYLVTQVDGAKVDKYHYEWLYHSEGDLIPITVMDADDSEHASEVNGNADTELENNE